MPFKDKAAYNAYMAEYMLRRYHRRRAEAIEQLGGRCVDCGTTDSLEFDHDDRDSKTWNMAKILTSGSKQMVQEELAKCVLRCNPCHIAKSQRVGDFKKKHTPL
ncbi:HNH endonuclease [Microbacterium phage Magritte]|nr:HNH endonuclease [Microbacterium phage Magritte]